MEIKMMRALRSNFFKISGRGEEHLYKRPGCVLEWAETWVRVHSAIGSLVLNDSVVHSTDRDAGGTAHHEEGYHSR